MPTARDTQNKGLNMFPVPNCVPSLQVTTSNLFVLAACRDVIALRHCSECCGQSENRGRT